MNLFRRLWADDAGFIISAELILVATIVVIGLIVGLVSIRNQVVQELVDVGQAIGSISQSFAYTGVCGTTGHFYAWTDGSFFYDVPDFCQVPVQVPGTEPGGISVQVWPVGVVSVYPPGGERW